MTETPPPKTAKGQGLAKVRGRLAWTALVLAFVSPALVALAVHGARSWGWNPALALESLTLVWAPLIALAAGALGLIAVLMWLIPPRRDGRVALAAVAIAGITIAIFAQARASRDNAPPIHDVSTDWRDPVSFSPAMMQARGAAADPVEPAPKADPAAKGPYAGMSVADVNAKTCPAALAIIAPETPAQAYTSAKQAMTRAGLKALPGDPASGLVEATATSFWFHLKDDIVIRVRPEGPGARLDIRSVSRSAAADGGSNCAHVTRIRAALME